MALCKYFGSSESVFLTGSRWAIGAVTGPAVGEALSEKSEWRWIFWINLPFVVTAFIILAVFASLKDRAPGSILAQLQDYDWIGFGLLTASVVSLLVGISWVSGVARLPSYILHHARSVH